MSARKQTSILSVVYLYFYFVPNAIKSDEIFFENRNCFGIIVKVKTVMAIGNKTNIFES